MAQVRIRTPLRGSDWHLNHSRKNYYQRLMKISEPLSKVQVIIEPLTEAQVIIRTTLRVSGNNKNHSQGLR